MAAALLIGTNAKADVAQIGQQTYATLAAAFAAATDGQTITMIDDATIAKNYTIILGKDGTSRDITLDLAGHTVSSAQNYPFALYKGTLRLVNSVPGQGELNFTNTYGIGVYGTYEKVCNPRTAAESALFTHLVIEDGVKINANGTKTLGVMLCAIRATESTNGKGTMIYKDYWDETQGKYTDGNPRGVAYGVRVDIKGDIYGTKYAVQTNGQLACYTEAYATYYNEHSEEFYGTAEPGSIADTVYAPFIHIYPTAKMSAAAASGSAAVYASGYARWLIEGECEGAAGVYMKSGNVTLEDAIVKSTYTSDATNELGSTKGVTAAGNAIVVESNGHYAGNCVLDIEGSTEVSTEAHNGTALLEGVAVGSDEAVEEITIGGGSFSGDNAVAIATVDKTTIVGTAGTEFTGDVTVGTTSDIAQLIPGAVVSYITNSDNTTTAVIATGASQEVYNVSLNGEGLSTFSALDNVRFDASAFKAYKAGEMSNDKLTLSQIAASEGYVYIPAGTGVILYGAASGAAQFERVTAAVPALEGTNNLKPSTAWKAAYAGAAYILHSNELWVYDGEQFADNKAFLILPNDNQGNAPKRIRLVFEETQDVENVEFEAVKAQKFIENGQIFIIRGEKVYNVQGQIVK